MRRIAPDIHPSVYSHERPGVVHWFMHHSEYTDHFFAKKPEHWTGGRHYVDAKRVLTAKESADYLRISTFTLRKIEKEGLIVPYRTPGGHRRYSLEMLNEYLENSRIPPQRREIAAA
jgi:excisionase family DNA binding protein